MLSTAKGLGLEVNSLVDERRDPIRSSELAAKYLKQLYEIYGDWSLAIASYNCGPGNVNKALRRAGGGKQDFWDIYYYLPKETRGYVPAFIAANYVMTYHNDHNIGNALAKRPVLTDTIHITQRVHFDQISEVLGIPVEEGRDFLPSDVPGFRSFKISGELKGSVMTACRCEKTLDKEIIQPYNKIKLYERIKRRQADGAGDQTAGRCRTGDHADHLEKSVARIADDY